MGGYITGSAALVDYVRSHGAGFIFTTSLARSGVDCGQDHTSEGREMRANILIAGLLLAPLLVLGLVILTQLR